MSLTLAINIVLMAVVLAAMVGLHHWAIRTQHRHWPATDAVERRRVHDRRGRFARPAPVMAERRRADRRVNRPATA